LFRAAAVGPGRAVRHDRDMSPPHSPAGLSSAGYQPADDDESVRGNRTWWDESAGEYRAEHRRDLAGRLVWGPERLDEADAGLLGDVRGRTVLEVGAGAADCSAWLATQGARAVATDLSIGMLRELDDESADPRLPPPPPRIQCDGRGLPFADAVFDIAFSAYGAVPFIGDPGRLFAEVARVLRPGGRWVFSVTHPVRWAFPDDPGPAGLRVTRSYFDRTPYVETAEDGRVAYAEHHRTIGDRVRELNRAGFRLLDLVEPEWPERLDRSWGAWSPLRGRLIPGTAIFVCEK
jgi:SAM-dependent methyltransferase